MRGGFGFPTERKRMGKHTRTGFRPQMPQHLRKPVRFGKGKPRSGFPLHAPMGRMNKSLSFYARMRYNLFGVNR